MTERVKTYWASEVEVLDRFYATTIAACPYCGGLDRCHYGCPQLEALMVELERHDHVATESEAHAEWHLNTGVPIWQGVCPWDCCQPDRDEDECPGHETTDGPIGSTVYCDGSCVALEVRS